MKESKVRSWEKREDSLRRTKIRKTKQTSKAIK